MVKAANVAKRKRKKHEHKLPRKFLDRVKAITAKRPKTVIDHILKHGYVTTEELKKRKGTSLIILMCGRPAVSRCATFLPPDGRPMGGRAL